MSAALCTGSPAVGGACGLAEGETVWPEIHRRGTKGGAHGYHDSLLLLSETDNYQTPFRVPFEGYGDSYYLESLKSLLCIRRRGRKKNKNHNSHARSDFQAGPCSLHLASAFFTQTVSPTVPGPVRGVQVRGSHFRMWCVCSRPR